MSEILPEAKPPIVLKSEATTNQDARGPSRIGEWWSLAKLLAGFCLIAFGCWRALVMAVGPDESLWRAPRVKAQHAAEERAAQKRHEQGVRDLKRERQPPEDQTRQREMLDRELATSIAAQPERDKAMYQVERWMELPLIVLVFTLGPGLLWAGKNGVRWPKLK